jgi:RimJ/RimL family protein N-acetyltransferase
LKKDFAPIYRKFWAEMFGISLEDISNPVEQVTSNGYYLDRHGDKYIFLYEDLLLKKWILAGKPEKLFHFDLQKTPLSPLTILEKLAHINPAFEDIDYCISRLEEFRAMALLSDVAIAEPTPEEVKIFLQQCSEDDQDTLDITFENEVIRGIYHQNILIGVARYTAIRETGLADITALVAPAHRGLGYSTGLISAVIALSLKDNLVPKYRVSQSNLASRAVAEKLGFTASSVLRAWDVS